MKATLAQVAKSLAGNHGHIGKTAEECGVTVGAIYQRIEANPKLQAILADLDHNTTTAARGVVMGAIADGDTGLAWKWLTTRDPAFRPSASLKLDDNALRAMMEAAGPDALRKMAEG